MDYTYEDNDYGYPGQNSYGNTGTSASGARGHFGDTSSFTTTAISKDGRFLGIKLPDEVAGPLSTVFPALLVWLSQKGEDIVLPPVTKAAKYFIDDTPKATRVASKTANAIGYGIILSDQIAGVGRNVYDAMHGLSELRGAVRPLAKADNTAPLSGSNEVVANARKKINKLFWHNMSMTAVSTIKAVPALWIRMNQKKSQNEARDTMNSIHHSASQDEAAEVLKRRIHGEAVADKEIAHISLRDATQRMIEKEEEQYVARMNKYVADHSADTGKKLEEIVANMNASNAKDHVRKLEQLGMNVDRLRTGMEGHTDYYGRQNIPSAKERAKALEHFKETYRANSESEIADVVRRRFVEQNGAFNRNQRYWRASDDKRPLLEDDLRGKVEKLRNDYNSRNQKKLEALDDPNGMPAIAAGLGGGIAGELALKALGGKAVDRYKQPIAIDRILHLRRELEKSGDSPPEMVPSIPGSDKESDHSYARYVHEIFQQHQKDCGFTRIGNRFTEHLQNARWDDTSIAELPDSQLNAYEYAVKIISKRIKDGRMDAITLVSLVGDSKNKIVHSNGRAFGPRGGGRTDAQVKEAITKLVDEKTMKFHGGHGHNAEDITSKLGDFVFSLDDLKKSLTAPDADPQERAFIFTLFSNVVGNDKELSKALDITEDRLKELRAESAKQFNRNLVGAVDILAGMLENDDKLAELIKMTEA
ncbi:MAG: hypothetical protein AB7F82_09945, partial [Alphaproteobacteria bacterium]